MCSLRTGEKGDVKSGINRFTKIPSPPLRNKILLRIEEHIQLRFNESLTPILE
jgi:hypothetical protein